MVIPIRAFQDNYIWTILSENKRKALIVDPGAAEPVLDYLAANSLRLQGILITHHHFDHCQGVEEIIRHHPVPVYGPLKETIPHVNHFLEDGDTIHFSDFDRTFKILSIPGHTLGHIAYFGGDLLFCGDTLFTGGCGKLFEGTPEQMFHSLTRLVSLPEHTKIYCGHEYTVNNLLFAQAVEPHNPAIQQRLQEVKDQRARNVPTVPSLLMLEKETNPFLRCKEDTVIQAVEKFYGQIFANSVAIFAALREWKNNFSIPKD